jgi:hypothetical protein
MQVSLALEHITALQCMKLMNHVTLNFNNNMSMAAVFLHIKKAFYATGHSGLEYKLLDLEFSTRLIKLFLFLFIVVLMAKYHQS